MGSAGQPISEMPEAFNEEGQTQAWRTRMALAVAHAWRRQANLASAACAII
jgi:hypothetical protein